MEAEKVNKSTFLKIEMLHKQGKFTGTVNRKTTFSIQSLKVFCFLFIKLVCYIL